MIKFQSFFKVIKWMEDQRTNTVTKHFNVAVVHLAHGLHFNMISMDIFKPFPAHVCGEILCHVLRKVVAIGSLRQERKQKKK